MEFETSPNTFLNGTAMLLDPFSSKNKMARIKAREGNKYQPEKIERLLNYQDNIIGWS